MIIKIIYEALFLTLMVIILILLIKLNLQELENEKRQLKIDNNIAIIAEQLKIDIITVE